MQNLRGRLPDPAGATGDQSRTCRHGVHAYLVCWGRAARPSYLDHGVARARTRGAGSAPASAITLLSSATHRKNDPKAHLAAEHSSVRLGHATERELLDYGVYVAQGTKFQRLLRVPGGAGIPPRNLPAAHYQGEHAQGEWPLGAAGTKRLPLIPSPPTTSEIAFALGAVARITRAPPSFCNSATVSTAAESM